MLLCVVIDCFRSICMFFSGLVMGVYVFFILMLFVVIAVYAVMCLWILCWFVSVDFYDCLWCVLIGFIVFLFVFVMFNVFLFLDLYGFVLGFFWLVIDVYGSLFNGLFFVWCLVVSGFSLDFRIHLLMDLYYLRLWICLLCLLVGFLFLVITLFV